MSLPVADVLDFEAANPRNDHRKEMRIRTRFGLSAARYYQRLHYIITVGVLLTQALEHDPITTQRLLRLQDERAAKRNTRKVTP